jgi:hypothetical protein
MRTMGIRPRDWVIVLERREAEFFAHSALAIRVSMDEALAGAKGELSIDAGFVYEANGRSEMLMAPDVVHVSHKDWLEGRTAFAYKELPYEPIGVCRYCRCTEEFACAGGCAWLDMQGTVCSAAACREKWLADQNDARKEAVELAGELTA